MLPASPSRPALFSRRRPRPRPLRPAQALPIFCQVVIRIEPGHPLGEHRRRRPEILLIDLAVLVDDERHHPGAGPVRRPRDQPEAAEHQPVRDVVVGATRGMRTLALQNMEVISMIGLRLGVLARMVAASPGLRDKRSERAWRLALCSVDQ